MTSEAMTKLVLLQTLVLLNPVGCRVVSIWSKNAQKLESSRVLQSYQTIIILLTITITGSETIHFVFLVMTHDIQHSLKQH